MPFRASRINSKLFCIICRIINQFDVRNFLKSLVKAERSGYNYVNKIKTKWAERQTYQKGEASFLYVEIQIYLAKKRILNHITPKRKLDKWCLSFLEMLINEKKISL